MPPASRTAGVGWQPPRAGWLAGSLARSLARSQRASSSPAVGGLHPDRGRDAEAPWEAREAEGCGGAAAEGAPSLLPALGAALGDFPSPGEKCVCVFGMERLGRACATQSCRIPDFSLPVSALARCDYGILRGRAGDWVACKTRDGSQGRAPLRPRTPRPSPSGFFPPTAPAELVLGAPRGAACRGASKLTVTFCVWRSFPQPPTEWS